MNIIGLGDCGCRIAKEFSKYPQYTSWCINTDGEWGENFLKIKKQKSHEDYEKKPPRVKKFFSGMKGDVLFVLGGSGTISGASLRILEQIKKNRISILYIKPDIELLSGVKKLQERVVYNVLQEYARSAVFERMYIVENTSVEDIAGEVPIIGYNDLINSIIVSNFHMINVFQNSKPVVSTSSDPIGHARISTIGMLDMKEKKENMFFSLDIPIEKCYYYGINEEKLRSDGKLLRNITDQVKEKTSDKVKVSYAIHSTSYKEDYVYVVFHSSKIQK